MIQNKISSKSCGSKDQGAEDWGAKALGAKGRGAKDWGRKVRGQKTGGQKTGGQKSCHHVLVSRVVHRWRQKLHRADPADTPQTTRLRHHPTL